jgi:predicted nucleic acid-binding protein
MIVDASVAIKWLVREDDSRLANLLIDRTDLAAPELTVCELANAIWKKWKRGELAGVPTRLPRITEIFDEVAPMTALAARAASIAIELDHPAYDCFYLALAEVRDDVVVTSDQRLMNKLAQTDYARLLVPMESLAQ